MKRHEYIFTDHSRSLRTIEDAFGILTARWRIILTLIIASIETTGGYVLICLALQSYLKQTSNTCYAPHGFFNFENSDGAITPGHWLTEKEEP